MKMRKKVKWLAVILCMALLASMASACGSSDDGGTKDIVSDDGAGTDATDRSEQENAASEEVTIEEQVLVNQNDIVITAQEYTSDSMWGDGIKLLIENNSAQDVAVGCDALIVNDYMINDLFATDVMAGKKANVTLDLSSSELAAAGIDTVGKIEIYFYVCNASTYERIFEPGCVTIETSQFANMDTTPDDAGTELYNAGGVRIVGKTVDEDSFWGTAILLYCENTSGRNVGISVDDMSVNGFMVDPYFYVDIYNGKKAIDSITVFSSDLEDNGIETIEEVEMKFHIYDIDTYETIADSDPIVFSAQ